MPTGQLHVRHFICGSDLFHKRWLYVNLSPTPMQEGYLYITGRMKEIIITASGEKVPPRPIEEAIKRELPLISNAIVIGDQQRFLCCLVTLKVIYQDTEISGHVFRTTSADRGRRRDRCTDGQVVGDGIVVLPGSGKLRPHGGGGGGRGGGSEGPQDDPTWHRPREQGSCLPDTEGKPHPFVLSR